MKIENFLKSFWLGGRVEKMWWCLGVFSPIPPICFLPKMERKESVCDLLDRQKYLFFFFFSSGTLCLFLFLFFFFFFLFSFDFMGNVGSLFLVHFASSFFFLLISWGRGVTVICFVFVLLFLLCLIN